MPTKKVNKVHISNKTNRNDAYVGLPVLKMALIIGVVFAPITIGYICNHDSLT